MFAAVIVRVVHEAIGAPPGVRLETVVDRDRIVEHPVVEPWRGNLGRARHGIARPQIPHRKDESPGTVAEESGQDGIVRGETGFRGTDVKPVRLLGVVVVVAAVRGRERAVLIHDSHRRFGKSCFGVSGASIEDAVRIVPEARGSGARSAAKQWGGGGAARRLDRKGDRVLAG